MWEAGHSTPCHRTCYCRLPLVHCAPTAWWSHSCLPQPDDKDLRLYRDWLEATGGCGFAGHRCLGTHLAWPLLQVWQLKRYRSWLAPHSRVGDAYGVLAPSSLSRPQTVQRCCWTALQAAKAAASNGTALLRCCQGQQRWRPARRMAGLARLRPQGSRWKGIESSYDWGRRRGRRRVCFSERVCTAFVELRMGWSGVPRGR